MKFVAHFWVIVALASNAFASAPEVFKNDCFQCHRAVNGRRPGRCDHAQTDTERLPKCHPRFGARWPGVERGVDIAAVHQQATNAMNIPHQLHGAGVQPLGDLYYQREIARLMPGLQRITA